MVGIFSFVGRSELTSTSKVLLLLWILKTLSSSLKKYIELLQNILKRKSNPTSGIGWIKFEGEALHVPVGAAGIFAA